MRQPGCGPGSADRTVSVVREGVPVPSTFSFSHEIVIVETDFSLEIMYQFSALVYSTRLPPRGSHGARTT